MLFSVFLVITSFLSGTVLAQSTACTRHAADGQLFEPKKCMREVEDSCFTCQIKPEVVLMPGREDVDVPKKEWNCESMGGYPKCDCNPQDEKADDYCLTQVNLDSDEVEQYLDLDCEDTDKYEERCPWRFFPGGILSDSMIVAVNGEEYTAPDTPAAAPPVPVPAIANDLLQAGEGEAEEAEAEEAADEGEEDASEGGQGGIPDGFVPPGDIVTPIPLPDLTFGSITLTIEGNLITYDFINECDDGFLFSMSYICGSCRWEGATRDELQCGEGAWHYPPLLMLVAISLVALLF